MTPKMWIYLGLAALIGLGLYLAGDALFDAGVNSEKARVAAEQKKAADDALKAERATNSASESVADTTRTEAAKVAAETKATTGKAGQEIQYVYRERKVSAGCPVPGPVPDGVRTRFREARAAAAAARGLPAAVER